jgi:ankyrin repeat protein
VGWTPLHFAARNDSGLGVARLLIEGQNVDVPDGGGTTPLMVAASYNNANVVELLLRAKADFAHPDNTGRNAYEYALLKNASEAGKLIEEARDNASKAQK